MLSRIAKSTISLAQRPSILYRVISTSSSSPASSSQVPAPASDNIRRYPHDAPERDFVNFPPPRVPEEGGKIRIGLVPDEWFQAMYDKTGVTGPYILFWGALATLCSKEVYIPWVDTTEHLVFLFLVVVASKVVGPKLATFLDKKVVETKQERLAELDEASKDIDAKIKQNVLLTSLPEANALISAAKRENVYLQLEAAFRQRLATVYQEVKKRLDYQVAVQSAYKRLEREQAISYIIGQVDKSIGPAQEKEAFQSGLSTLKALSTKYAGTI